SLITLAPGATNNTIDAGLFQGAQLGDRVWFDTNKNGVQDANEAGVAGVKVSLLDANGVAVASPLTTDANGNYLFSNLKPGTYSVQFDKTTLPAGYVLTSKDLGGNDANDSDANLVDGKTAQVTLASGEI
ncbi:SdrD B-like domain-containing protein, partial [Pseudomonas aeruginosa]|nr:SdrD B-like domain-containing protein [Pseudomonas aeruginosa]